jgi:hypothetical protein
MKVVGNNDIRVIESNYNKKFRQIITDFLISNEYVHSNLNEITKTHDFVVDESTMEYKNRIENGRMSYGFTTFSKCFYDMVAIKEFQSTYFDFLISLYEKMKVDFYFQKLPNVRIHFPNESCKETFPFFHTDRQLGHPPSEINLWMPISNNKNCTFSMLSYEDSLSVLEEIGYDYNKLENKSLYDKEWNKKCVDGSITVDGENGISGDSSFCLFNNLRMHSVIPPESETRVSMDTRIVPVENFDWNDKYVGKGRVASQWWPGGKSGYHSKSIWEIKNEKHKTILG